MKANDRAGKGNFVIKLQHTLYITEPDLVLKKDGQTLRAVHSDGHSDHITLHMVDQIVTYSGGSITPDVLGACATAGVGFSSFSQCGRFQFRIVGATTGNVLLRKRQYEQIWLSICCRPREGKEAKRRRWRIKRACFEEGSQTADTQYPLFGLSRRCIPSWVSRAHPSLPLRRIYHFIDSSFFRFYQAAQTLKRK